MVFETIVETMIEMSLFELFFPWLLTLAVTFGVLDKYDYFDEDSVNAVVALAVSFIAIGGAYLFIPASLFPHFAAAIAFGAFGLIGLLVLMALAGYDLDEMDSENPLAKIVLPLGVLVFVLILFTQFDFGLIDALVNLLSGESFDEVVMPILTMIFLLGIVAVITRGAGSSGDE